VSAVTEVRGVARYRELFANDHAAALFAWSIVARLPLGMAALALILLVRSAGGDYAEAGLVTAAYGVAIAIGAPYAGRQVDRCGQRSGRRTRENLDVDAELGQPPRGLDDVDVHAPGIAGSGLIKRRCVNTEHRYP